MHRPRQPQFEEHERNRFGGRVCSLNLINPKQLNAPTVCLSAGPSSCPPSLHQKNRYHTRSVLGYCLLPVIGLAALGIVWDLTGNSGHVLALLAVAWCTVSATRLFEEYLDMRRQRYLVAYPVGLLYACFVLITVY